MSPKLPRITAFELLRALKRDGWQQVRQHRSHLILRHPKKRGRVTIAMHSTGTVRPKTLDSVLKQAELTVDELRDLL